MKLLSAVGKRLLVGAIVLCFAAGVAGAQEPGRPVMENVFFNVVWGSAFGATLGVAVAVIASDDESAPDDVRESAFTGATAGGLIGLGIGLYLVYQGITFDAGSSRVGAAGPGRPPPEVLDPPIQVVTSGDGRRVTGFRARVFQLKF